MAGTNEAARILGEGEVSAREYVDGDGSCGSPFLFHVNHVSHHNKGEDSRMPGMSSDESVIFPTMKAYECVRQDTDIKHRTQQFASLEKGSPRGLRPCILLCPRLQG